MAQENKYLTFGLKEEEYAIPILNVKEIIGMMSITKVPRLPEYIIGVLNLRGKIVPVLDLRLRLGMQGKEYDARTSIIVVELQTQVGLKASGIIVDTVHEVMSIDEKDIDGPPQCEGAKDNDYLIGVGKIGEKVIMLLDPKKILFTTELEEVV